MDHLTAVNSLLKLVGTRKVDSVDVAHPDVVDAVDALALRLESLLKRGWWFNRDRSVTMEPSTEGYIFFATNVLRYELADRLDKRTWPALAKRGNRLYNADTQTYVFDQCISLNLFTKLDWVDLPDAAQQHLIYKAGADYVRDKIEDHIKSAELKLDAQEQMNDLHAEELLTDKVNMLESPRAAKLRAGRRPYSMYTY